MSIRSKYDNDYGVKYYIHSFKKVFEEVPEGIDFANGKKREDNTHRASEELYEEKSKYTYRHKRK